VPTSAGLVPYENGKKLAFWNVLFVDSVSKKGRCSVTGNVQSMRSLFNKRLDGCVAGVWGAVRTARDTRAQNTSVFVPQAIAWRRHGGDAVLGPFRVGEEQQCATTVVPIYRRATVSKRPLIALCCLTLNLGVGMIIVESLAKDNNNLKKLRCSGVFTS
jgi:hypothetical protein